MTYPATITVPIAEDFCRGQFSKMWSDSVKHCLLGWALEHFGPEPAGLSPYRLPENIHAKLKKAVGGGPIPHWNDKVASDQDLADAYERFLVLMGYEVTP